jgi:hypothetical protein
VDGKVCPYLEHAPVTVAGRQAWDAALRAPLRYYPNGRAGGFDTAAFLAIVGALGYDAGGVLDLLPAVEAGLSAAFKDYGDEGE